MNYQERLLELQDEIKALNMEAFALIEARRIHDANEVGSFSDRVAARRDIDCKLEDIQCQVKLRDNEINGIQFELRALDVASALESRTTFTAMNEESLALQRKQVELLEIIARKLCPEQLREW